MPQQDRVGSNHLQQLARHAELEGIKAVYKAWQDESHAPYRRLSFLAATNEIMLRVFAGGYAGAWSFLVEICRRYPQLIDVITPPPAGDGKAQAKAEKKKSKDDADAVEAAGYKNENRNFINWISRQTDSDTFSLWEAAVLVHACRARQKRRTDEVIASLSPYQQYLLEWSDLVLQGQIKTSPRESNDSGASHAEWRDGKADAAVHRWYDLHQAMSDRHRNASYWNDVFRGEKQAGFIVFRRGLKRREEFVQTYLSLVDGREGEGNQGIFSFAHLYLPRSGSKDDMRPTRGLIIPSESMLYLVGVRDAANKMRSTEAIVDFRKPVEVIAIPVVPLVNSPVRVQGLALTSNQEGSALVSQVTIRRTKLTDHSAARIGTHSEKKLKENLEHIRKVETGKLVDTPEARQDLEDELNDILENTDNLGL